MIKSLPTFTDQERETIAAIATPPGRGGVGIVRISGPQVIEIANNMVGKLPTPRYAQLTDFKGHNGEIIDQGLVLFFPAPHSFTGEDVLELHGHGGPQLLDVLLGCVLQQGARLAQPGEFSQRAFLNGKIDLAQAEAIADVINAATKEAALSASRSLQGEFSKEIGALTQALMQCRMYVEAAIDFPEEEIDFLSDGHLLNSLNNIESNLLALLKNAKQGNLLKEGMTVVILGQPNAGKSSLLNALAQCEAAIVTPIAGTTRDLVKETIQIDGLPVHIIDTAGIRSNADVVELEGIKRANAQLKLADRVLLMVDAANQPALTNIEQEILAAHPEKVTVVFNKIDLIARKALPKEGIAISAKTGQGMEQLKAHLKACVGFIGQEQGIFVARRRHLLALEKALAYLKEAIIQLITYKAGECCAEELRLAQGALGEITGKVTSDDLLGEIFSHFCIGK